MKKPKPPSSWPETAQEGVVLRSDDGRLFYWLRATRCGLWVHRERRRLDRAHLVQSHVFRNAPAFARWCDADTVRFDYPVVHAKLQREGHALLNDGGPGDEPASDRTAG